MSTPPKNPYQAPLTKSTPSQSSADDASSKKIRSVAKAQRMLNLAILAYLLMYLLMIVGNMALVAISNDSDSMVPLLLVTLFLGIICFVLFAVARMAYTMHGVGHAIVYTVAMLFPCLGIILLVILNARVTKFLKSKGVKVGLMGADKRTLP